MMQAGCCCGGECSCPQSTSLPSSVIVTIVVTSCAGAPITLQAVATLGTTLTETCGLASCACTKYEFTAVTETAAGCQPGGRLCQMPYASFDLCDDVQMLVGITSLAVATNGLGSFDPPYDCKFWTVNARIALRISTPGAPQDPAAQASTSGCQGCSWFNPTSPCLGQLGPFYLQSACKFNTASPIGSYEECAEICNSEQPPCENECSSGFTLTSITVA